MNDKKRFIINNKENIDEFIGDIMISINKFVINVPNEDWVSYDRNVALIGKFLYMLIGEYKNIKIGSNFKKLIFALNKVFIELQPYWVDIVSNIQETIILNSLGVGKNDEEE